MEIVNKKLKSGKMTTVLRVAESDLTAGLEARAFEAAALAAERNCSHFQIVNATGQIVQYGAAAAPLLTAEQAARRSGPEGERHDW